jgi:hypothetical protein
MKTASITFRLTLDIAYSDYLDAQWIADSFLHSTSKMAALIKDNPEFFAALCEEGVVEWLTPFVLAKPKQSNHPAPDTTQP